jgi:hypothetical protein
MNIADILNLLFGVAGLLGTIFGFYSYYKGREQQKPRCHYTTHRDILKLSVEGASNIRIYYKDQEVHRVFTTYIWIWNAGKRPIKDSDIPTQSPIILTLADKFFPLKLLDFRVIKQSRDAINFQVLRNDDASLKILFSFFDQNDGAVIEIQHTGSLKTEVIIEGIILGVVEGFKITSNDREMRGAVSSRQIDHPFRRNFTRLELRDRAIISIFPATLFALFSAIPLFSASNFSLLPFLINVSIILCIIFLIFMFFITILDHLPFPKNLEVDSSAITPSEDNSSNSPDAT